MSFDDLMIFSLIWFDEFWFELMIFALTISIFWTFDQFQHGDHAGNENDGDGASEDEEEDDDGDGDGGDDGDDGDDGGGGEDEEEEDGDDGTNLLFSPGSTFVTKNISWVGREAKKNIMMKMMVMVRVMMMMIMVMMVVMTMVMEQSTEHLYHQEHNQRSIQRWESGRIESSNKPFLLLSSDKKMEAEKTMLICFVLFHSSFNAVSLFLTDFSQIWISFHFFGYIFMWR